MAYARTSMSGDGSTRDYVFGFPYLDKSHIKVQVDNVLTTAFTFVDANTIRFDTAPSSGADIKIFRATSPNARIVDYSMPSSLNEADLDNDSLQAFYLAQEASDNIEVVEANAEVNVRAAVQGDIKGRTLAPIIAPMTNGLPNLSKLVYGTNLNFSADTIFFDGQTAYVLPSFTVVELALVSSSAKLVWLDPRNMTFTVTAWNSVLTEDQNQNFLLVAVVRNNGNDISHVSITCPYTVDNVLFGDCNSGMAGIMPPGTGTLPNYNSSTNELEFAHDTLLFHRNKLRILSGGLNIPLITSTSAVCVYWSWINNQAVVRRYDDEPETHETLLAVVRRAGANSSMGISCAYTVDGFLFNERTAQFDGQESLTPIIPPSTQIVPDIRFYGTQQKLFFPNDTLLFWQGQVKILPETEILLNSSSSTKRVFYNFATNTFSVKRWNDSRPPNEALIATIRINGDEKIVASMACPYTVNGNWFGKPVVNELDAGVRAVAHRGYSVDAPENTLIAYKRAFEKGFRYVEVDLRLSSDGTWMCIHDSTIDRTSNGTGAVSSMTEAVLKTYDYGSYRNAAYAGEQIPNVSEFLTQCKRLGLHPYLEIKEGSATQAEIDLLVQTVSRRGMKGRVSYIAFDGSVLDKVLVADPTARVGELGSLSTSMINDAIARQTATNQVFIDADYSSISQTLADQCHDADIPIEAYTLYYTNHLDSLIEKGVSGITTDRLNIARILQKMDRSMISHV